MKFSSALTRLRKNESGIFIPIVAVIALGVFAVMIILGLDTTRMRNAQLELSAKMDAICGNISRSPGNYESTIQQFHAEILRLQEEKRLRNSTLEKVLLIMPTLPVSDADYNFFDPADPVPPVMKGTEVPFTDFGLSCIPGSGGAQCYFRGLALKSSGETDFPDYHWNNMQNSGNSVGCIAEAKVTTFIPKTLVTIFGGDPTTETTAKVKSVWWSPVRGPYPAYDESNPIQTSSGLTIAIGTEMFTSSWERRFRFDGYPNTAAIPFRSIHDPIFKASVAASFVPFESSSPTLTYDANRRMPALPGISKYGFLDTSLLGPDPLPGAITGIPRKPAVLVDGRSPDFAAVAAANNSVTLDNFDSFFQTSAGSEIVASDRDAMMVACRNPLTLVRNTFVSTIVELASRQGQLRNMTEILHINPKHREKYFYPPGGPAITNFPTQMVSFGQDLNAPAYQLPFIFYYTGPPTADLDNESPQLSDSTAPPPGFIGPNWHRTDITPNPTHSLARGTATSGWLNPFVRNGVTVPSGWLEQSTGNPEIAVIHRLVAGQLRSCYHMYRGNIGSAVTKGIERVGNSQDFFNDPVFLPASYTHPEPVGGSNNFVWPNALRPTEYAVGVQSWEQVNPWSTGTGAHNSATSRGLTAAELVSTLGTTQLCPYTIKSSSAFFSVSDFIAERYSGISREICPLTTIGTGPTLTFNFGDPTLWTPGVTDVTVNASDGSAEQALELEPDVLGLMRYFTGVEPALASPGIFPIKDSATAPEAQPFLTTPSSPYVNNSNCNAGICTSSLLLVLHQPITSDDDKAQIKAMVAKMVTEANDGSGGPIRPITIVYFPSNYMDHSNVESFIEAFTSLDPTLPGYLPSVEESVNNPIVIYNVSPYDVNWGKECGVTVTGDPNATPGSREERGFDLSVDGRGGVTTLTNPDLPLVPSRTFTESEVFSNFWRCLLTQQRGNIATSAYQVFNDRILRRELKF